MVSSARDLKTAFERNLKALKLYRIDNAVSPGWGAVRYATKITSPAPEERVCELIDQADRHSSVLDIIRRAVPVRGEHQINGGAAR